MIIIVEKDVEKRIELHNFFASHVPSEQLLTVKNKAELLMATTREKVTSIWIASADQGMLTDLRRPGPCEEATIYVLAASSLDIDPFLLKRYNAKSVLTPLRPYQVQQLVTGHKTTV